MSFHMSLKYNQNHRPHKSFISKTTLIFLQDTTTIDPNSPSSILGGREAVVERRCVVRIELAGRCVAVRARAARRLRHVLRPVLAKYGAGAALHRAVLRDGAVLHPDTLMQVCLNCVVLYYVWFFILFY